jgi:hypothetical protein
MRITRRADAAWAASEDKDSDGAEIDAWRSTLGVSGEAAVATEAMLGKFLGEWQHAHSLLSFYDGSRQYNHI